MKSFILAGMITGIVTASCFTPNEAINSVREGLDVVRTGLDVVERKVAEADQNADGKTSWLELLLTLLGLSGLGGAALKAQGTRDRRKRLEIWEAIKASQEKHAETEVKLAAFAPQTPK